MSLLQSLPTRAEAAAELLARRKARQALISFITYTMPRYEAAGFHREICSKLEAVERGEIPRLMIQTPPRHGKSQIVSRHFPAWYLGRNPVKEFISASYGSDLAVDFGRDVRNIVGSPEFHATYPNVSLAEDSKAKNRWHTNEGGGYIAAGVGTSITGRGADLLNIDDPVKDRAEAESQTVRDATWNWYTSTAYTRLMPGGAVVLTQTRWHEDDLTGRLIAAEENGGDHWEFLTFPAFNVDGTALWPERYPKEALDQIRASIGERDWSSLYEQRPRPVEGSFFTINDLLVETNGVLGPAPMPQRCDSVFATIDSATKTGKTNDGTGVIYWARSKYQGHPLIILDYDIVQIEGAMLEIWLPQVFARLKEFEVLTGARAGSIGAWIEDKASGMILLQQAQRNRWPAHPIESKLTSVGKVERAINVSAYVFRKMVKFGPIAFDRVKSYKGVSKNHLLSQILGFHVGTKDMGDDDLLDCFSYGIAVSLGDADGI